MFIMQYYFIQPSLRNWVQVSLCRTSQTAHILMTTYCVTDFTLTTRHTQSTLKIVGLSQADKARTFARNAFSFFQVVRHKARSLGLVYKYKQNILRSKRRGSVYIFHVVVYRSYCSCFSLPTPTAQNSDEARTRVHESWQSRHLGYLFLMLSQHYHVFYLS